MDLALLTKTKPFYVEYEGQELTGRYNNRGVTPEWTSRLDLEEGETLLKHVRLLCEVIDSWDLKGPATPYAEETSFSVGDVISFRGNAYRVLDFDAEFQADNGESPSPSDLPSRGEEGSYGPFTLHNIGEAGESYDVPVAYDHVKRLPQGLINRIIESIIEGSRGDVDDAKKDG